MNQEDAVLLSIESVGKCLDLGRTKTYQLLREGTLKSVSIGRRRLVPRKELERFVDELAEEAGWN